MFNCPLYPNHNWQSLNVQPNFIVSSLDTAGRLEEKKKEADGKLLKILISNGESQATRTLFSPKLKIIYSVGYGTCSLMNTQQAKK